VYAMRGGDNRQRSHRRMRLFLPQRRMSAVAVALMALVGCVSIHTHERLLRETRDREVEYAKSLAVQVEHGDITANDMMWFLQDRCK
jgi:hypothetical protein